MRRFGSVESVRGLGRQDHLCWGFDQPGDFRDNAAEFLSDGLARGLKVGYVVSSVQQLTDELGEIDGLDDLIDRGAVETISVESLYGANDAVEPEATVAAYAAATEKALAEGFDGFRVSADATTLVATAPGREAFARYEVLVDRYMSFHPFSAMCGYSTAAVGGRVSAELACLHPLTRFGTAPFQLFNMEDGAIRLVGDVDLAGWDMFRLALNRIDDGKSDMVVDLSSVGFIDHRGLSLLADYARETDRTVVLRGAPPMVTKVVEILPLRHLRLEGARYRC